MRFDWEMLTCADEADGTPGSGHSTEGPATLGMAIHLRHDHLTHLSPRKRVESHQLVSKATTALQQMRDSSVVWAAVPGTRRFGWVSTRTPIHKMYDFTSKWVEGTKLN